MRSAVFFFDRYHLPPAIPRGVYLAAHVYSNQARPGDGGR